MAVRLLCLLLFATVASGAEVTRVGRWELHSSFWMNLHQTLMHDATARAARDISALSPDERTSWETVVAAYRQAGGTGNITFARPMMVTQDELTQVADEAVNAGISGPLADAIRQAAPVYRSHWWALDDAANRFFLGYAAAMLRDAGEELAHAHEAVYHERFPKSIRVDITAYAEPFGAYSHTLQDGGFVITMSSRDPGYQGLAALEMLLHESSHSIVSPGRGTVSKAIAAAATKLGVDRPRDLWHAILFATSSELTRRALVRRGAAAYEPSAQGMFARVWPKYGDWISVAAIASQLAMCGRKPRGWNISRVGEGFHQADGSARDGSLVRCTSRLRSDARLRIRRCLAPKATMKPLAEFFPLLRRHPVPALGHSPPKIGPIHATTTHTKTSEQNPAESQQSDSLPEANLSPSEQRRQQPVPQMHHHLAADEDEDRDSHRRGHKNPFPSHTLVPHFFLNSS